MTLEQFRYFIVDRESGTCISPANAYLVGHSDMDQDDVDFLISETGGGRLDALIEDYGIDIHDIAFMPDSEARQRADRNAEIINAIARLCRSLDDSDIPEMARSLLRSHGYLVDPATPL